MLDDNLKNGPAGSEENQEEAKMQAETVRKEEKTETPEEKEIKKDKEAALESAAENKVKEEAVEESKEKMLPEATAEEKTIEEGKQEAETAKTAAAESGLEETTKELEEETVTEDAAVEASAEEATAGEAAIEEPIEGKEEKVSEVTDQVSGSEAADQSDRDQVEEKKETGEKEPLKLEIPVYPLAKMDMDDHVKILDSYLKEYGIAEIKNHVEELRKSFTKKFRTFLKEKKESYLQEGGKESEFHYSSPVKNRFDELIQTFKRKRQQYYKDLEQEQANNLKIRLEMVDELKELIDTAEPSSMYKNFKNLQERWKSVGQVPHSKYNDVWRTYHHHVERFYDLLHLNNDFRDLDFKHNLEEKTKLIEVAEKLARDEDVNHAFKELQILHRMWKEDIGPVAREYREEIWNRFSAATKMIHKRRHEYQDKLDEKFRANVDLKLAVIDKIKALETEEVNSHKGWQAQIKKLEALREEFFAIGKVPRNRNEEIWQLFRSATKEFNSAKNKFYKSQKKNQSENLAKKMLLIQKAEEMKDSEDFNEATELFKRIQAEWKQIGHVPRSESDKIWKRFKDACNYYFDRLHQKQDNVSKEVADSIGKKKDLLDSFKKELEEKAPKMEDLDAVIVKWRELGPLPAKLKHLDAKFNKVVDQAYGKLDIGKEEASFLKFKNMVDGYLEQNNARKLNNEQLFIRKRIDEIIKEIKQLENNISFISNASKDNPLVRNVYENIESHKKDLETWKRKLGYISSLEY